MLDSSDLATSRHRFSRRFLTDRRSLTPKVISATTAMAAACCFGISTELSAQRSSETWEFRTVESADLLFHGLAVVGLQGFSSLPLYDRDYAARVRAAKEARGIYPTRLDRQAGSFLEAFERDSTFELFHFLPLYFGTARPETVLEVFSEVAAGSGARSAYEEAAFASSVLESVFRSRSQRQVLAEYADVLEEEWEVFLRDYSAESSTRQSEAAAEASREWHLRVAPAVAGFLDGRQMSGGLVMVSAALGPEGRVFAGDPESTEDNVFAVSSAFSGTGLGISAYLLKELCYPVASGVVAALGISRDRVNAERLSGRLAVRCGAELLADGGAGLADDYRATFLAAAAATGISGPSFETAYPVEANTLERLRRDLRDNTR
jgi:hypothetical protein